MLEHHKFFRKFYQDVQALCNPDAYNLVLHKHLGDVFYAIGAKCEFEAIHSAKLRFIVRPQHKFLMQMYGITDYSVYDLDVLVKKNAAFREDYFRKAWADHKSLDTLENQMFSALFPCIPRKGCPFVCENMLLNNFLKYPHFWGYRWATNLEVPENFRFEIPRHFPAISNKAGSVLKKLAPKNKIVLFAPDAETATEFAPEFWNIIAEYVHRHGYLIFVNSRKYKIKYGVSLFELGMSLQDVVAVGLSCSYIFALRSGLCDVLVGAREKLYAFYPAILHREFHSLNKCFEPTPNINEVAIWRWQIGQISWEGENLTVPLQKYIDSLYRSYVLERTKTFLMYPNRRKRVEHRFCYRIFRCLAGDPKVFPENNIENTKHKYPEKNFSLIGIPIYTRKFKSGKRGDDTVRHLFLGGLAQIKRTLTILRVSFFGISLFSRSETREKLLGVPIRKFEMRKRWLNDIQTKIGKKYDHVYFIRHNIGESYVELLHFGDCIKANRSKRPLLICWNDKYLNFYRMFLPKNVDMQYVNLHQGTIHKVFDEGTEVIVHGGQRFICHTPRIAENMYARLASNPATNFYDYINECNGIPKDSVPVPFGPEKMAIGRVEQMIRRIDLGGKFVLLCPEASSLVEMSPFFWDRLVDGFVAKGYDVFVNLCESDMRFKKAKNARMTIEEILALSKKSQGIVTLGSGLCVLLTAACVKMDILYTDFNRRGHEFTPELIVRLYSVFHIPGVSPSLVKEYDTSKIREAELAVEILGRYS